MTKGTEEVVDPTRKFIRACVQWTFYCIGEGFIVPEEVFWAYSQATGDEDWETISARLTEHAQESPAAQGDAR